MWVGFAELRGQLAIENRQIKAMLKEAGNVLRTRVDLPGMPVNSKGKAAYLKAMLAEDLFVEPHWIGLGVPAPTHTFERPVHVMTPQGPRTSLKRTDVVDDATLRCRIRVVKGKGITQDTLDVLLTYSRDNGLGADRSQGSGTFTYELTQV